MWPSEHSYVTCTWPLAWLQRWRLRVVLSRIYGAQQLKTNNYSRTLSSLAFVGTIVGMLSFGQSNCFWCCLTKLTCTSLWKGYLSDKFGRKFGMVSISSSVLNTLLIGLRCQQLVSWLSSLFCLLVLLEPTEASVVCWACLVLCGMYPPFFTWK